jgi:hypothetical protein
MQVETNAASLRCALGSLPARSVATLNRVACLDAFRGLTSELMQRPLWQSQTEKKSPAAPLEPSARPRRVKTPMGWTSPDADPNALLLASVVPSSPPSLLSRGVRSLARFGLAVWSVRTGDVLPWLGSLRPGVRWSLVACASVIPVLGLYQGAASSAASRTTQALTPATLTPAVSASNAAPPVARGVAATPVPQPTPVAEPATERVAMADPAPPDSPSEGAEAAEAAQPEAAAPLDDQPSTGTDPSESHAHKHRKGAKKTKARATKHVTKSSSRRHRAKPDAE